MAEDGMLGRLTARALQPNDLGVALQFVIEPVGGATRVRKGTSG